MTTARFIQELFKAHKDSYARFEKVYRDVTLMRYQGRQFNSVGRLDDIVTNRRTTAGITEASFNLTHCLIDTALAGLVPPNPRACVNGRTSAVKNIKPAVDEYLSLVFYHQDMHHHYRSVVFDCLTGRRGIFKVAGNLRNDIEITTVNPSRFFFDQTARDYAHCRYHMEYVTMGEAEFMEWAKVLDFDKKVLKKMKPSVYPEWTLDPVAQHEKTAILKCENWVNLIYYVDRNTNELTIVPEDIEEVLGCCALPFGSPYFPVDMVYDGVGIGGLSEAQLIAKTQDQMDNLLTMVFGIVARMNPGMMYDADSISAPEVASMAEELSQRIFSLFPIKRNNQGDQRPLSEFFKDSPMPTLPPQIEDLLDRLTSNAAAESAFVEASRGKQMNVRTAKELQLMEAQLDTRLSVRVTRLNRAMESVASRVVQLSSQILPASGIRLLDGPGGRLTRKNLSDTNFMFETVAYSPLRDNPSVMSEMMQNWLPIIQNSPSVNQEKFMHALIDMLNFPPEVKQHAPPQAAQPPTPQVAPNELPQGGEPPVSPMQLSGA